MTETTAAFLAKEFVKRHPLWSAEKFEEFDPEDRAALIRHLGPREIPGLFRHVNPDALAAIILNLEGVNEIFSLLEPVDASRVISRMNKTDQDKIFQMLDKTVSQEIAGMLNYPPHVAGTLMDVRIQVFHPHDQVGFAIEQLRKRKRLDLDLLFLVEVTGELKGIIRLQDLIGAEDETALATLSRPVSGIHELTPRDEIIETIEKGRHTSLPVIDSQNILLGVIRQEKLFSIAQEEAFDDLQKMVGVSSEEKALSPAFFSVRKRLPWLSVNLLTTFIAAIVVGFFEDTIARVTALAVLLPIVAGQSGNTGAQAQAVTMRGLALREIRLRHKGKVLLKEARVGLINGLIIGALCAASVLVWSQSAPLAGVIGSAMILAMVCASLCGAAIPMILTAMDQDPATSSSIILTTITDVVGFLSFLGLATVFSQHLN